MFLGELIIQVSPNVFARVAGVNVGFGVRVGVNRTTRPPSTRQSGVSQTVVSIATEYVPGCAFQRPR